MALPKVLPYVLTGGAVLVAALWQGYLTATQLLLVLAVVALQFMLRKFDRIARDAVPLEVVQPGSRSSVAQIGDGLMIALSGLPLVSVFSVGIAAAVLTCAVVILSPLLLALGRRLLNRQALRQESEEFLLRNGFKVVFYVSGTNNAGYVINQWLPVGERLGVKCCICIRQPELAADIHKTSIPIVHCRTAAEVEKLISTGVRTILYPANSQENFVPFRYFHLNHFFINHGESDKAVNQHKVLMAYDKLLVAGPLAERRLRNAGLPLRDGQVEHVGRPQTQLLLERRQGQNAVRRILYAPTWEGFVESVNYSSVAPLGLEILKGLAKTGRYEVILKPHPFTGRRGSAQKSYLARMETFCGSHQGFSLAARLDPIFPLMNWCDLLIADIGSVVNDFLATGKPIILCNAQGLEPEALETHFPTSRAAYKLTNAEDLQPLLAAIDAGDPLASVREEVRKDSLGDFPDGSLERFRSVIAESLGLEARARPIGRAEAERMAQRVGAGG